MTEEQIIELGLKANLLNYVDNETPRRYFVCGNADLEDVKDFACLVSEEQEKEIERLREALRFYAKNHYPNIDDGPWGPNSNDWGDVARDALGEKE